MNMNSNRFVTTLVILGLLLGLATSPAFAAQAAQDNEDLLSTYGVPLSASELNTIEGDGWVAGLTGAVTGAVIGYGTYLIRWSWNRYVNRRRRRWSWSAVGESTATAAFSALVLGLAAPTP